MLCIGIAQTDGSYFFLSDQCRYSYRGDPIPHRSRWEWKSHSSKRGNIIYSLLIVYNMHDGFSNESVITAIIQWQPLLEKKSGPPIWHLCSLYASRSASQLAFTSIGMHCIFHSIIYSTRLKFLALCCGRSVCDAIRHARQRIPCRRGCPAR